MTCNEPLLLNNGNQKLEFPFLSGTVMWHCTLQDKFQSDLPLLSEDCGAEPWPHDTAHLRRFRRLVTSRFMDSADSVTSSSSRCMRRRLALAREASSSASSSWRFSCFSRRWPFSTCQNQPQKRSLHLCSWDEGTYSIILCEFNSKGPHHFSFKSYKHEKKISPRNISYFKSS